MLYVLIGKNIFARDEFVQKKIYESIVDFGSESIERIDASEMSSDEIISAVQATSFLSPHKLIIIKRPEANNDLSDTIDMFLDRIDESNDVIVLGHDLDKRKSAYKNLLAKGEKIDCRELDAISLARWAVTYAEQNSFRLEMKDAHYLIKRLGENQLLLSNEIKKLGSYNSNITQNVIDSLTEESLQSTIFTLLDSLFSDDSTRALRLYRQLRRQQEDPRKIASMINWQIHNIALAKAAQPQNEATLVSAGISPFVAQKSLRIAKKISRKQLKDIVSQLIDLDIQLRSNVDNDSALEYTILSIAQ